MQSIELTNESKKHFCYFYLISDSKSLAKEREAASYDRKAIDDRKASGLGWRSKIKNQVIHARPTLAGGNEAFAVGLARRKFFSMMNHAIRAVKAKEAGLRQ